MMIMHKHIRTLIAVVAICFFSLAIPTLTSVWQDTQLMAKPMPQEQLQDIISEEAREIPIVYALHKRKNMGYQTGRQELDVTQELKDKAIAIISPLLTAEQIREAKQIVQSPEVDIHCRRDDIGFVELYAYIAKDNISNKSFSLVWHEETGKAIQFFGTLDTQQPIDVIVYKEYLGLDAIDDFEALGSDNIQFSKKAQIHLKCEEKELGFTAMAVSNNVNNSETLKQ